MVFVLTLLATSAVAQEQSTCFGTTSNGTLSNGWKLPVSGPNYSAYSTIGASIGRTYVHSDVYEIVVEAYAELARSMPNKLFVYGETGRKEGGEFEPHRTHRNGLSVDFMVPVVDETGRSLPISASILNKWGYGHEFDLSGRLDDLEIDAEALAEHIFQLHKAAKKQGDSITRVIFDPQLQGLLHNTFRWPYLRDNIRFSERPAWIRHDEHYHVDFDISCERGGR